ncbi:MAG: phage terminase large subunit [Bariatricus sp.]
MNITRNERNARLLLKRDLSEYENLNLLFETCRNILEEDKERALKLGRLVEAKANEMARKDARFYDLYIRALLFLSRHYFHEYLLYVEHKRPPEKQFYLPRCHVLRTVVEDLQDLEDGVIDFLGVSMPPRVGKSTTCIFFMTWQMGLHPDMANLMSGHSDPLTKGFYKETLNIIRSEEYCWKDVFPDVSFESTSAEDEAINLNSPSRFPTLTCRSIEGTTTGAVEAANLLYTDDLIKDRKESLSPQRLETKYQDYLNKILDRKLDNAKELMVGTRWNVADPLGKIQSKQKDNPRYRFRVIPALNEDDESNFVYKFGKGFSTKYYKSLRETLDNNEWMAKYQGRPFKREGLLFPAEELKTYNGVLPVGEPDVIMAAIDVAWGGGDSLAMPILYVYGGRGYVQDVVFSKGDKTITMPLVEGKILQHRIQLIRVEGNNGGHMYSDVIDQNIKNAGYFCNITNRVTGSDKSKMTRMVQYAPEIKQLYFINDKNASKEYREFMEEVTSLSVEGKNEHDDAPDSLAMLIDFWKGDAGWCEPVERPW